MSGFQGQSVIVTGGGSGIGRACALAFARAGARVIVADMNVASAEETLRLIESAGEGREANRAATALELDVSDERAVASTLRQALSQDDIHVLVNSAGIGASCPFLETDIGLLDRMMTVNFRGTFLCSQVIAQAMVERGIAGNIVNIGSASGARGNAGRAAYGATKAAVTNLTQVMAVELAAHGIRINAVAPGPIETPLVDAAHTPDVRQAWLDELPMGCYGRPEDVASAVLYLASEQAAYVTGHVLHVDGGFNAAGVMLHHRGAT